MILMGHFAARDQETGIATTPDKVIYLTTANIALVLFMFFSGYGLSLKSYNQVNLKREWLSRLKKIYPPLLFVGILYVVMCFLLPDTCTPEAVHNRKLPLLIHEYRVWDTGSITCFLEGLLGYKDWYVVCIIYFYTFFYLSQYIARKTKWNFTIILSVIMLVYWVAAYYIYSWPQAHFFRYPCAFMIGHLVAKHSKATFGKKEKITDLIILMVFIATVAFHGAMWVGFYLVAMVMICVAKLISCRYEAKHKSLLYILGIVSYFYYLSHGRISYPLMYYLGIDDLLVWTIFTGLVSYGLWKLYGGIKSVIRIIRK